MLPISSYTPASGFSNGTLTLTGSLRGWVETWGTIPEATLAT